MTDQINDDPRAENVDVRIVALSRLIRSLRGDLQAHERHTSALEGRIDAIEVKLTKVDTALTALVGSLNDGSSRENAAAKMWRSRVLTAVAVVVLSGIITYFLYG